MPAGTTACVLHRALFRRVVAYTNAPTVAVQIINRCSWKFRESIVRTHCPELWEARGVVEKIRATLERTE